MSKAIERRHFLIRALSHKHITQEAYDKEMPGLEKQIAADIEKILKENSIKLSQEIKTKTVNITDDGNFKRTVGAVLINFLSEYFDEKTVKGCLRQGYKLMRGK